MKDKHGIRIASLIFCTKKGRCLIKKSIRKYPSLKGYKEVDKLEGIKLIIVPATYCISKTVFEKILKYAEEGNIVFITPPSLVTGGHLHFQNYLEDIGITVHKRHLTNYEVDLTKRKEEIGDLIVKGMSIKVLEEESKINTRSVDIFEQEKFQFTGKGVIEKITGGKVLADFENGDPALVKVEQKKGSIYYLAPNLIPEDYAKVFDLLMEKMKITRPVRAVKENGETSGIESMSVELGKGKILVYILNFTGSPAKVELKSKKKIRKVKDLIENKTINTFLELSPLEPMLLEISCE